MQLTFGDCELDTRLFALRRGGQPRAVEPLVFNLLAYLAQHRDRIVLRRELFDALWAGKVVSESTLGGCIRAARRAVGDDGQAQWCIATLPRRGYRFVAPVFEGEPLSPARQEAAARAGAALPPLAQAGSAPPAFPLAGRRSRIAVMPFAVAAAATGSRGGTADGLTHDVIAGLARLRSLFVTAPGSVFSLQSQGVTPLVAAQMLEVDYLVSGAVHGHGSGRIVRAELVQAPAMRLVWSETFELPREQALQVRDRIANAIVACLAAEVELAERNKALLKPPEGLDAWEAYHRGLWHMYLFTRTDNEQARRWFDRSASLDPGFASAHAGLSFTHFQEAFQGWAPREPATGLAFSSAGRSLVADERNPLAHWAVGRALWLRGDQEQAVNALEQAVAMSPSFALGHYMLAFVHAQAGDPQSALAYTDHARALSPFDPLLFGMLGARALALVRLGRFDEAAHWAAQAAAQPNAHPHILAIAVCSLALARRLAAAQDQAAALRRQRPGYGLDDFLSAFRFDALGARRLGEGARRIGMG